MTDPTEPSDPDSGERIAKVLAHAGIASRRDAERLIEAGRISVNGRRLSTPAFKVNPGDEVRLDGELIAARPPTRLWRHHKPVGRVTTHKDPEGRETVFDSLPEDMGRVISIGRLDLNSEGLLLLTNDGELARVLELPATGWTRRYRVRAYGDVSDAGIARLKEGITVDGVRYGPVDAVVDRRTGSNIWLTVGLKEGKNREVRKVLEAVGLKVNRLLRLAYGPLQLGALKRGETEEVKLSVLRDQMGRLYPLDGDGYPAAAGGTNQPEGTGRAKARPRSDLPQDRKPQAGGDGSGRPVRPKSGSRAGWAKAKPARVKPRDARLARKNPDADKERGVRARPVGKQDGQPGRSRDSAAAPAALRPGAARAQGRLAASPRAAEAAAGKDQAVPAPSNRSGKSDDRRPSGAHRPGGGKPPRGDGSTPPRKRPGGSPGANRRGRS